MLFLTEAEGDLMMDIRIDPNNAAESQSLHVMRFFL